MNFEDEELLEKIDQLAKNWDYVVSVDTRSYGYEVFVRISDIFLENKRNMGTKIFQHPSRIVREIAQHVYDIDSAPNSLFQRLWIECRKEFESKK